MLDRAIERIARERVGTITAIQGDVRDVPLPSHQFDIILAAMVLHHLRDEREWRDVFAKFHQALRPGGALWVADHVSHGVPGVDELMVNRWGEYLVSLNGEAYRDRVFAYTAREDSPRPLLFQPDLLRATGFRDVEVLHKNGCFAAFGAFR